MPDDDTIKLSEKLRNKNKREPWNYTCPPVPRIGLMDISNGPPTFSRGDVGWAKEWARFLIVLHREDSYLMAWPCKADGSTDGLAAPVLILEERVEPTGVHREI